MDALSVEFVPYRLRMPITDDLSVLREELSLQRELHGRRSVEAQVAFENLFATSCRVGRPLDGLRRFSSDESERFFAQVRHGIDGHVYWLGAKGGFTRNDRKTRRPARWWYEYLHGVLTPWDDVVPKCGQPTCINPDHMLVGRDVARRRFTDEQMLGTLQVCAMRLGHPPTTKEFEEGHYAPWPSVYKLRFGSWHQALIAAGVGEGYSAGGKKATPERARESVKEARRFIGHLPGYDEFQRPALRAHLRGLSLMTSCTAIRRQIGPSWKDVLRNVFGGK